MSLPPLQLLLAIVLPPVILNLFQWRRDLRHLDKASRRTRAAKSGLHRGEAPRVSFLVAAWNEESRLRRCIEAVLHLPYPNLEILLCAGGTDRTWEIASGIGDHRVSVLEQRRGDGKQKSLRRCLEKSNGEIIYLLDADCFITEAAFASVLRQLVSGAGQAVSCCPYRPITEQLDSPFVLSQCACRTYASIHRPEHDLGLSGANSAVLRKALERAGGFRAEIGPGGDYDLGKRLLESGARILHSVDAAVPTEFHPQVGAYLRQQARWLRNVAIHGIRFRAYKEVAMSLSTSLIGLAMLVIPCLWVLPTFSAGISPDALPASSGLWTACFLHALLSRVRYLQTARVWLGIRFPVRVVALLPVFLLIDFVAWTIPLCQYPVRHLRARW